MRGKTAIVTGANRGIGRETARALAAQGAEVILACRNLSAAQPVCDAIRQETGNPRVKVLRLDLASLHAIHAFARHYAEAYHRLDVLINNAGTFSMAREETEDGFEKTIGTNYLGPFLLTHLLVPSLERAPAARIVNLSSNAALYGRIDLDDLQMTRGYHGFRAYAASKLAVVLFTLELAGQLARNQITVNALHPGHVATGIWPADKWYLALASKAQRLFAITAEEAARFCVHLASSGEVAGLTGQYFDRAVPRELPPSMTDRQFRTKLWQYSQKLVGIPRMADRLERGEHGNDGVARGRGT